MLLLFSFSPTLTRDTTPQRTQRLVPMDRFSWDRRRPRLHAFALLSTHDAGIALKQSKTEKRSIWNTVQWHSDADHRERTETFTTPEMARFKVGDSPGWMQARTPALPGRNAAGWWRSGGWPLSTGARLHCREVRDECVGAWLEATGDAGVRDLHRPLIFLEHR